MTRRCSSAANGLGMKLLCRTKQWAASRFFLWSGLSVCAECASPRDSTPGVIGSRWQKEWRPPASGGNRDQTERGVTKLPFLIEKEVRFRNMLFIIQASEILY